MRRFDGTIIQQQFLESTARLADDYYGLRSGSGSHSSKRPGTGPCAWVGGPGAGTLAAYGRTATVPYAINPSGRARAHESLFSRNHKVEVALGDAPVARADRRGFDYRARLLERRHPVTYSRWSVQDLLRHLKPGGVLAVHISNLPDLARGDRRRAILLELRQVEKTTRTTRGVPRRRMLLFHLARRSRTTAEEAGTARRGAAGEV